MTTPADIAGAAGATGRVEGRESGQAIVEAAIVMPAMVFLILTLMQLTMVQHARIMTDYAAYCAARAGIVFNADNDAMTQAATVALMPTMGRTDTLTAFGTTAIRVMTVEKAKRLVFNLPIVRVTTLSPRKSDFSANLSKHVGGAEIDFDDVRAASVRPNQLQLEVKYLYRMPIPFANQILQSIYFASRPGTYLLSTWGGVDMTRPEVFGQSAQNLATAAYVGSGEQDAAGIVAARLAGGRIGGYFMPLRATYTMRMQSNAYQKNAGN